MAESLRRYYLDGRLTQDDFDERVGKALAARTQGDLAELVRDLPQELGAAGGLGAAAEGQRPRDRRARP